MGVRFVFTKPELSELDEGGSWCLVVDMMAALGAGWVGNVDIELQLGAIKPKCNKRSAAAVKCQHWSVEDKSSDSNLKSSVWLSPGGQVTLNNERYIALCCSG